MGVFAKISKVKGVVAKRSKFREGGCKLPVEKLKNVSDFIKPYFLTYMCGLLAIHPSNNFFFI